ncbi:hypothetical protein MCETE7_00686 [Acidimicrobiia bacterium]
MSARELTRFRLEFLGRSPSDASIDDEKQLQQSRDEIEFLERSGNFHHLVSSWMASDEFKYQWTRNPFFNTVLGLEDLKQTDKTIRPLIHIHIPKTAGTTLNRAISSHLPTLASFSQRSLAELLALPLARLLSFRFIAGHYGFTAVNLLAFRNPIVFSMARDPLELYPSKWRYFHREQIISESLSLEEWLATTPGLRNSQTRGFTLNMSETGPAYFEPHEWVVNSANSDENLLRMLQPSIDRLDYLAPSENVDDLYLLLHAKAGLPGDPLERVPRLNTTEREEISSEATELIREMSQVDSELYRLAQLRWAADSIQP